MEHDDAIRLYSEFIKPGDLVFDVGANIGQRMDIFLELGATVVAVEPNPICITEMRAKHECNARVFLVQKACDATAGVAPLTLGEDSTTSSLSLAWINKLKQGRRCGHLRWVHSIQVELTTLDHLIDEFGQPAFCKVDVEGYEQAVFKGLSRPIKALSFEFTPEVIVDAISCIDRLSELGMHNFNYSLGESGRLVLDQFVGSEDIKIYLLNNLDGTMPGDAYARL